MFLTQQLLQTKSFGPLTEAVAFDRLLRPKMLLRIFCFITAAVKAANACMTCNRAACALQHLQLQDLYLNSVPVGAQKNGKHISGMTGIRFT